MGLIETLAERLGYTKTATIDNPSDWLRAEAAYEQFNIPDLALPAAQAQLYQRLSWVQVAVSQVANAAAVSSFQVFEMEGEETVGVSNHAFEKLLRRPNPSQSRFEFLRDTFSYQALTGNAYWWMNRANEDAEPDELWLLPSHKVKPVPDGNMYLRGYLYDPGDGEEVAIEPWEVVHFRRFHPLNGYVGLSPVEAIAVISEGDLAAQQWNRNFFAKDNAKLPGLLTFDQVDENEYHSLQKAWQRSHGGTSRGGIATLRNVTPGSVNWTPLAMPQGDIEFHAGRVATKEEIFAIYAPGLSSVLDVNATEANAIAGKGTFIEFGVWPHMVAVAEKITNDVLPAYGDDLTGEFDDIRAADREMKLAEQNEFSRYHTIDEVRSEFYGAEPLGDERGEMLPAQIGQTMVAVDEVEPPAPQEPPPAQSEPEPDAEDDNEDSGAKRAEARTFRKWLKRYPTRSIDAFKADHLSDSEKMRIAAGMVGDEGDAAGDDAPFLVASWDNYP